MPLGVSRINNNISKRVAKTITNGGGATLSSTQAKFGPTSLAVSISASTSSHFVTITPLADLAFTGDFTYECWIYPVNLSGTGSNVHYMIDNRASTGDTNAIGINVDASGRVTVSGLGQTAFVSSSSAVVTVNNWQHVAVTRSGTTVTLWVGGTSRATGTSSAAISQVSRSHTIGRGATSTTQTFRGYIDEVRYSNIARYTAAFTPDTTRFQNDGNTVFLSHFDGVTAATTFVEDNGAG